MRDIGVIPGGSYSSAADINDRDQVVGYGTTASGDFHAIFWDEGAIVDIGTLPGGSFSQAFEINRRGQVVGVSSTAGSPHIFLWEGGRMIDLGVLPGAPTVDFYSVPALNDRGQVAGQSPTASGENHAVLWTYRRGKSEATSTHPLR
jgi:probable HAF family extracellular repeat protein